MERPNIQELQKKAIEIRKDILKMLMLAGSGHTGGSLSIVEILIALYYYKLRNDPKRPDWKERDIFLLSKGHACPALYAVLAHKGYFPKEKLWTLRKLGSLLQGHPQMGLAGVEISSGSLGQGLSIANGISLAARLDKLDIRIYCLLGDGETNEGQVWEAVMTASHYKLDKVCAIIDFNKLQIDGFCCDVKDMGSYMHKWKDFGWHAIEVDGHDFTKLIDALDEAGGLKGKPTVIIAHTVKGKGVSFIENKVEWHGVAPKKEEYERAMNELEEAYRKIQN
ncbi:MAG: transketolase [Omnitrophica bacterium RIFCSPLOWO2_01_FULL_45_10]|nr:MAG: transketolase [Omnitrophica bacterium RIFCSPLOWO2_01_FULL_45_10]